MATINKLPSGSWRVRFPSAGRRKSASFATEAEAQQFAESLSNPQSAPVAVPTCPRLDGYAATWFVAHTASTKPSTKHRYKLQVNTHILPHLGLLHLDQLTPANLRSWQSGLLATLSPATVKLTRAVLGMILKMAVDDELIPSNPLDRVKMPKVPKKQITILTPDEIHGLKGHVKERYRALVDVMAFGGLRLGEAIALTPDAIDWDTNELHVRQTVTEDQGGFYVGPPKTEASYRTITLPQFVMVALKNHREAGFSSEEWMFTGRRLGDRLNPRYFRNEPFTEAKRDFGRPDLQPHDLRHTAVSLWILQGASPKLVASRAGHSSVSYVLDTYGHLYGNEDSALAGKLEEFGPKGEAEAVGVDEPSEPGERPTLLD